MTRVPRAAVAVIALALLAGCGHRPGAAFQIGDTSVDRSTVDAVTNAECKVLKGTQPAAVKARAVWSVVNQMVLSTAELGYADSHGTTYDGAALRAQLAQFDDAVDQLPVKLPADQLKPLRAAFADTFKGDLISLTLGRKALAAQGTASPEDTAARTAGNKIVLAWARKQGLEVDPRYSVGASDAAGAGDGSISRAVTSYAKSSASASSSQAFLADLPAAQLCG